MASPKIQTPAEIIFDNTPSASATTPSSGNTLVGVDETTKKLYSINDAGVKTDYGEASGGGGGGSGIMGQDEGVPLGTGTILNVVGNLINMSISGSVLRISQTDPTFPQEIIGIYGQNQGVPLGTGTVLNVDGSRLSMSISGSVLRITNSSDPQELIGVMGINQGSNLGTGTTIDWGLGMNAAITGSVLYVHPFAGGTHGSLWRKHTGTVQGTSWANVTVDESDNLVGNAGVLRNFKGSQNNRSGTYTTDSTDLGKIIFMDMTATGTVTIHSTAPQGFNCIVVQKGVGQTSIAAGGTGAIRNRSSHSKIAGQYGAATVLVESNAGTAPQVYIFGDTA